MRQLMLKTSIGGACVLGFVALGGPAQAVSPPALAHGLSLVTPVMDQEDRAVEEDLRPNEVPQSMEGEGTKPMMEPRPRASEGSNGGNIEDETIDRIVPGE